MDYEELSRILSRLGIAFGKDQEGRPITVLRAVIQSTEELDGSCTFGDIYDRLVHSEMELRVSKAWVHRILKSLVEDQLIRLENPDSMRKNYVGNVQTVASGLETLKEKKWTILSEEMNQLREQIATFDEIECGYVAEGLVQQLTGQEQILTSRFLRGVDELNRVLKYNIHAPAKKGDIIRMSMMWLGPFGQGILNRSMKYFESASQGVETRWLANMGMLVDESAPDIEVPLEIGMALMLKVVKLRMEGHKIDVRLYAGAQTYNASILNADRIAMIISDNPMTATYVTKEFNPDLIEDAVSSFDSIWERAISLFDPDIKSLEKAGIDKSSYIGKLLPEITKMIASSGDIEHGEA
ncbi:MAG: hypothetical protein ACTSU3_10320 [Candidatus Thorarchaeota archaeon]